MLATSSRCSFKNQWGMKRELHDLADALTVFVGYV